MGMMNRLGNAKNPYQGDHKKVLCVCSAGLLRSPTTAVVLSQEPFNYNTRAAGVSTEYALVEVDQVLLTWADEIVCMEDWHQDALEGLLKKFGIEKKVYNLDVPDRYPYRHPELMKIIKENYLKATTPAEAAEKAEEKKAE